MSDFLDAFANAIATMEGYFQAGTIADRNNNPGNLRGGPNQAAVVNNYGVYDDVSKGWADLMAQIQRNISRGLTLNEFFGGQRDAQGNVIPGGYPGYAPSADRNNPANYAKFVAGKLGIPVDQPISDFLGSATPGDAPAAVDNSDEVGSVDWPMLALTAAAAAAVYFFFFRG